MPISVWSHFHFIAPYKTDLPKAVRKTSTGNGIYFFLPNSGSIFRNAVTTNVIIHVTITILKKT